MNSIEINVNSRKVKLYGNELIIEKEKTIVEKLELTGNEDLDRLIIQECIDKNKLKSDISYDGNKVYPFERIVKEYRKLQKTGSLKNLTKEMYCFFMYRCGDIAHYNIEGYKSYYNYSTLELENRLLKDNWLMNTRYSDVDKIFKELKIGKYFNEREYINLDDVSISKLKSIIKDCGWNVTDNGAYWKLDRNTLYNNNFSFKVDISSNSVTDIVTGIQNYYKIFDKNDYIEKMVDNRKKSSNPLTIRQIVADTDNIGNMLSKLADDVLYKSRLVVEEKTSILNSYNTKNNDELDYEY